MSEIAERIAEARRVRGMSQGEVARIARLPPSAMSHYERNERKPSADNLKSLALALNVSSDYLLGLANAPHPLADSWLGLDMLTREQMRTLQNVVNAEAAANLERMSQREQPE